MVRTRIRNENRNRKERGKLWQALAIVFAFASIACVNGVEYSANVIAGDIKPPVVAELSANPTSIAANGVQESQLNVTVTDQSGIYSVTVNLSSLGGSEAEEMVKIDSDVYTTTTTAAVGTPPGTYGLLVNATDNSTNRNSNTSVCIQLTVTAPQVITYDFSTGAGSDKWAYRKQHNAKPPATTDVPNVEFTPARYNKIKVDDSTRQKDRTTRRKHYAIHRFKFDIEEPDAVLTKLTILWDGSGYRWFGRRGATLYIWNFETSAYEQLDRDTATYLTLEGTISDNIEDYIADDGSLIIIVEQNSPQRRFWWWKFRSHIGTDYVKLDVTY